MKGAAPALLCLLWAAPAAGQSAEAPSGFEPARVSGRVRAEPRSAAKPGQAGGAYSDRDLRYARKFDYEHLKNVVVYALPVDTAAAPATGQSAAGTAREESGLRAAVAEVSAPPRVTLREAGDRGFRLEPAFLAVAAGRPMLFANASRRRASLAAGGNSPASLSIRLAPGEEKTISLEAMGLYEIFCLDCGGPERRSAAGTAREENGSRAEKPAQGKIFAAGPYFALADGEGRYALELPPGSYQVSAWHERLPEETRRIELRAGEKNELDFTLSVGRLPQIP